MNNYRSYLWISLWKVTILHERNESTVIYLVPCIDPNHKLTEFKFSNLEPPGRFNAQHIAPERAWGLRNQSRKGAILIDGADLPPKAPSFITRVCRLDGLNV